MPRQPGGWLGSSHSFKECVTAHWSSDRARIIIGHQAIYRSYGLMIIFILLLVVAEHSIYVEAKGVSPGGVYGKENVGMSNDKIDEKSIHRKSKVSWSMLIRSGLVGA